MAATAVLFSQYSKVWGAEKGFPIVRTPEDERKFKSKAVESLIEDIKRNIGNKELAWLFENCFPNTLDTTVDYTNDKNGPDTYVITGDIDAMWLRDSSAQVWPYLLLCNKDEELKQMVKGVIRRQVKCIIKDPYANAFYKDPDKRSPWHSDLTDMKPGVHERKWEIDSLCYPIRLAHGYYKATEDTSPFDAEWAEAMILVIQTFKDQQRINGKGPYSFMRKTEFATDTEPLGGYGYPVKPNGMVCSAFRPSDDATIYPYLVPSNFFAFTSLGQLKTLIAASKQPIDVEHINNLMEQIGKALQTDAKITTKNGKEIYAYEINGYGSYNLMDDANVPSLLSLGYLIPGISDDPVYKNTRDYVLSPENPFFFIGKAGEGIGGPHAGMDRIWPISIAIRGITSNDETEIKLCLYLLQRSNAGTGFMHESFNKDNEKDFTRPWFAWANTLFGEFIWKVYRERPHLLNG